MAKKEILEYLTVRIAASKVDIFKPKCWTPRCDEKSAAWRLNCRSMGGTNKLGITKNSAECNLYMGLQGKNEDKSTNPGNPSRPDGINGSGENSKGGASSHTAPRQPKP